MSTAGTQREAVSMAAVHGVSVSVRADVREFPCSAAVAIRMVPALITRQLPLAQSAQLQCTTKERVGS
jgi:hypothetical protein